MESLKLCSCVAGELGRETDTESQPRTGPTWQHLVARDLWVLRIISQYYSMLTTVFLTGEKGQGRDNDSS